MLLLNPLMLQFLWWKDIGLSESLGGKAGKTTRNLDGFEPGHAQSLARCHPLMICHGHLSAGSGSVAGGEHAGHDMTRPALVNWSVEYMVNIWLIYG